MALMPLYYNFLLKYALWTIAVGAHLVGRCVLYSYCFLNPLIWWIATWNIWNLRQHAWPKPNDVKSLQSWASRTRQASGRWGGSMKSVKVLSKNDANWRRTTYRDKIQLIKTFVKSKSGINFKRKLDRCMMNYDNHLRRFNETLTNWQWMSSVKNPCIHNKLLCMTCSNNKIWTMIFVKNFAHLIGMCT